MSGLVAIAFEHGEVVEYELRRPHQRGTAAREAARIWRAMMLAPTLEVCEALLRGEVLPIGKLDADWSSASESSHERTRLPRRLQRDSGAAASGDWLDRTAEETTLHFRVVGLEEFVAVEEPGAEPLVGSDGDVVIPEDGDVMFYGDGGAGKTTLAIDLTCHLAAGDDWLGIPIGHPARVLLIENEGPRPLFRAKLRRKLEAWQGSSLDDRVQVLEQPWGKFSFADEAWRELIAATVRQNEIDVVIVGPLSRSGMNEAGTLQEVREFMELVAMLREQTARRLAVVLIHHENKGGQVSGAWEGAGDTLFHVQAQGHGSVRLHVQKARWAPGWHKKTLQLTWAAGEGFEVSDAPDRDDNTLADAIRAAVRANPGASWNVIEKEAKGNATRLRQLRDRLLAAGHLIDAGKGNKMELWDVDDPAKPMLPEQLRPGSDAVGTHPASNPGDEGAGAGASGRPVPYGDARTDAPASSPASLTEEDGLAS